MDNVCSPVDETDIWRNSAQTLRVLGTVGNQWCFSTRVIDFFSHKVDENGELLKVCIPIFYSPEKLLQINIV